MLGDVAQSMNFEDDYAYIVVNNSNTVEVVNRYTFESIATISEGLQNPRYIEFYNGKAYVSNWGDATNPDDDFIAVIDLNSNSVVATIPVSEGPEKLEEENGKLYVAQQGGYGYGNTISVIDLNSNSVSATIQVSDVPAGMEEENGFLYVLCSGKESWTGEETPGGMYKINLQNNQVSDEFEFETGVHPGYLAVENDKVYYSIGNSIYQTSALNIENSTNPILSASDDGLQILYGLNVENSWIYACDAKDFQSNGALFVYDLNGNLDSEIPVGGYLPRAVYFED
jgi:YVTN family beta-propeller protein